MDQNPFANLPKSLAQQKAEAQAALDKANREAEELMNELNGQPPGSDRYRMPSPYAPGDEPARDPVESVKSAMPGNEPPDMWQDAWNGKTLPVSVTVDVASKIRNALRPK